MGKFLLQTENFKILRSEEFHFGGSLDLTQCDIKPILDQIKLKTLKSQKTWKNSKF